MIGIDAEAEATKSKRVAVEKEITERERDEDIAQLHQLQARVASLRSAEQRLRKLCEACEGRSLDSDAPTIVGSVLTALETDLELCCSTADALREKHGIAEEEEE